MPVSTHITEGKSKLLTILKAFDAELCKLEPVGEVVEQEDDSNFHRVNCIELEDDRVRTKATSSLFFQDTTACGICCLERGELYEEIAPLTDVMYVLTIFATSTSAGASRVGFCLLTLLRLSESLPNLSDDVQEVATKFQKLLVDALLSMLNAEFPQQDLQPHQLCVVDVSVWGLLSGLIAEDVMLQSTRSLQHGLATTMATSQNLYIFEMPVSPLSELASVYTPLPAKLPTDVHVFLDTVLAFTRDGVSLKDAVTTAASI